MERGEIKMNYYFVRGIKALRSANKLIKYYEADEADFEDICLCLSLSMELFIKGKLFDNCVKIPKTHQISQLLKICYDNNISVPGLRYDSPNTSTYDNWSIGSRYSAEFYANFDLIKETSKLCGSLYKSVSENCMRFSPEAIAWCRKVAPPALMNASDDELWTYMRDAYYASHNE